MLRRMLTIPVAALLGVGGLAGTATADTQPPVDEALVTAYIDKTVKSVDAYWTAWLKSQGLKETHPLYKVVQQGETFKTECDNAPVTADESSAYYCPDDVPQDGVMYDGTLVLPIETMLKMRLGNIYGQASQKSGDFTVATTVAHEMGHWVQDDLINQIGLVPVKGKNNELMADCFAGVWTGAKYYEGNLTGADFEAAVDSRSKAGDEEFANPNHHGTPGERVNAWWIGYFGLKKNPGNNPINCIDAFSRDS